MIKTKEPQYPKRVRNELRFRELTVLRVERVGAAFQRIVLGGEALEGFVSRGFDDHTKLFFPQAGTAFTPPQVTEEGINWGKASVRQLATTRRCMMPNVMNWPMTSSSMTAVLPAAGRWRQTSAISW